MAVLQQWRTKINISFIKYNLMSYFNKWHVLITNIVFYKVIIYLIHSVMLK